MSKELKNGLKIIHFTLPSCQNFQKSEFGSQGWGYIIPYNTIRSEYGAVTVVTHEGINKLIFLAIILTILSPENPKFLKVVIHNKTYFHPWGGDSI